MGHEAIIINNNPETVSTDFDTSDRLYFDPLTPESVMEILLRERADGILLQFGGQTAINLALPIEAQLSHLKNMGVSMQMAGTSLTLSMRQAIGTDLRNLRRKIT